ncbi:hypothetical protein HPB47_018154, partial [Ixodes persulcatus]
DTRLREAGAEAVYCLTRGAPKGPNKPRAQLNHQGPLFPGHGYATHSQTWVGEPTWLGVRSDAIHQAPTKAGAPCGDCIESNASQIPKRKKIGEHKIIDHYRKLQEVDGKEQLRVILKLIEEYISLDNLRKMNVRLAWQVKMSPLPAVGSGGEYKKKKTEDRTSTVSLVKHARLVGKLRSAKQRVVNLEQELQIERMLSRRLQKQLLALLGERLLQLAQQQFLQLVLLLKFTLCELVWLTLHPYRPPILLLQQRIL